MNTYKDFFIDIDKFDEDNISYVKPMLFYKVTKNMGIYYKKEIRVEKDIKSESKTKSSKKSSKKKTESDSFEVEKISKKQKIIIRTPKMMLPFDIKEFDNNGNKSYQMCLSFKTLTNLYNEDEIKKFFQFIKKIDTVNEETIMEYKKDWNLPSKIKYKKTLKKSDDFPYFMNVNLPFDEKMGFLFNIYDESANKAKIDILEKKSIISCVIELTDLKFTDTNFRANWNVMQIRKFKPYSPIQEFFMTGCFICDEDDPEDKAYMEIINRYKKNMETPINIPRIPQLNANYQSSIPPPPPHIPQSKNISIEEDNSTSFRPPTLDELLNTKNKLKKTTTIVKGLYQNTENDMNTSIPPPPPPPPSDVKNTKKNKTDSKVESKSNSKIKSKSDSKIKSKTDSKVESKLNSKAESKTNLQLKSKQNTSKDISDSDSESDSSSKKRKKISKKTINQLVSSKK